MNSTNLIRLGKVVVGAALVAGATTLTNDPTYLGPWTAGVVLAIREADHYLAGN